MPDVPHPKDGPKTLATGDPSIAPTLQEVGTRPARSSADPAALPVVSPEHYAVEGEFARGGMGRILTAEDRRLGRTVALKELHGEAPAPAAARFVREALVTARLQHPAIVPIYEAGRWPSGVPFYAMKLVSGRSLDAVIRSAPTLAGRIALLPHLIAVAEAVAYAHSERIVHRDLKPANVLVGAFGETVVVDWGLAKDLAAGATEEVSPAAPPAGAQDQTVVGTVMGTPHYMPPEQARGEAVDERADVYALGAILYYLLTGTPPHSGKTAAEALAAAVSERPEPVERLQPEAPQELVAIVRKAMAPDRAERYPTARELAADLKRFQTGQLVSVHQYSTMELVRRWLRRHRAAVTVGAVLGTVLLASLIAGVVGIRREARRTAEERDKARMEAAKAEQINRFVQRMLGSANPQGEGGRQVSVVEMLDEAGRLAESQLKDQPEVQAAVRTTIGTTYQGLGLFEPAARHLETALALRRKVLGPEHADVAQSIGHLGGLREDQGDLEEAERLYRQALAMFERLGLGSDLDAVMTMENLARVLQGKGDSEAAERLHRKALAEERRLLGNDDPTIASTLNNLAVVLGSRGDWAAAEPLHREALALIRKARGPEHPEVAAGMSTLASVLEAEGKRAEAETLYREALAMRRKLLGNEHPDVASSLYHYAYFLRTKGDPPGAAGLAREVLALRGKTLPDAHPMVAATLQVLGLSLADQGQARAAEPVLRESLALRRKSLPPGHWLVASSESILGACLTTLGRFREAEPLLVGSYQALTRAKGAGHERTVEARSRVAALYEAWGRPEKATAYRAPDASARSSARRE